MPLQFKAPPAVVSESPADATGHKYPAIPHLLADQPHDGRRSPMPCWRKCVKPAREGKRRIDLLKRFQASPVSHLLSLL